jgi:hypothetical protein
MISFETWDYDTFESYNQLTAKELNEVFGKYQWELVQVLIHSKKYLYIFKRKSKK